jgi:Ca-activated chloride channel family protein
MKKLVTVALALSLTGALFTGCGAEEARSLPDDPPSSRAVTQGGPPDIALFRRIVAEGGVPSPETLDPVGFFAEHALELPPADCGEDLCLHPMLAVAPRFNGGNWTMAFVAMNTPVDPSTLERPPLHLVIAIERSNRTETYRAALENAVRAMAGTLRPEDRLSVLLVRDGAEVILEGATYDADTLDVALLSASGRAPGDRAGLYDAIATAGRLVEGFEGASRILLLTSGLANAGITDPERIVGVAEAYAREGVALSVVGMGDTFDPTVPQLLGEIGAGTYAVAESPEDLDRILRFEGETTLFPLATEFALRVTAAPGYRVGRIYGARRAFAQSDFAELASPALFIGHRMGASDVGGGRRGGGGGLFVELIAEPGASTMGAGRAAFEMQATWIGSDGAPRMTTASVVNPLAPGQNPDGMWPELTSDGKPFMMLNMYLALRAAVDFYESGDCAHSRGVVDMMALVVEGWQARYDDPDIWADNTLMLDLRDNMEAGCAAMTVIPPEQPRDFDGGCMFL